MFLISNAYAQAAPAAQSGAESSFMSIGFMVLIFIVFYFLLIRPQQKRMKDQRTKIDAVKKGDQVVTAGGLIGKVVRVDDIYVDLELGTGVKVKAVKSTLSDVLQPGQVPAAND